jgi:predicted deacylase
MGVVKIGGVAAETGRRATGVLPVGELDQLSFARGQIEVPLIVVNGAKPGPKLLVLAGCHAGEYVGMEAAIAATREVDPAALSGALVAIPVVNPQGFAAKVPYINPLDNLNINRQWPGDSGGTVGQRITYAIWHEVIANVDYLIDMHGGDFPEDQADYTICIQTGDGALDAVSENMARHFGLPYIRRSPPSEGRTPTGSSARMAQKLLGKPSITSEAGDAGRCDPQRMQADKRGILNVMRLLKMLPEPPVPPPSPQRAIVDRKTVFASTHGLCRAQAKVWDYVKAGQVVAEVADFYGDVIETLRSPIDGMVVQVFFQGATNPGNIVMKIGAIAD